MKIYKKLISLALLAPIVLSKPVFAKDEYTNLVKNTEVYFGPDDDYEVIGTLDSSDNIKIISEAINDYYLIKSDDVSGFIPGDSLSEEDKNRFYFLGIPELKEKKVVEAQVNVNVREDASVESKKIGLLWGSEMVDLISDEDSDWYKVNYYGQVGYVSSKYVKVLNTFDVPNEAYKIGYFKKSLYNEDSKYTIKENTVGYIVNEPCDSKYTILIPGYAYATVPSEYIEEVDLDSHNHSEEVEKVLIRIRHENKMKENNK